MNLFRATQLVLMQFEEMIPVYSENQTISMNTKWKGTGCWIKWVVYLQLGFEVLMNWLIPCWGCFNEKFVFVEVDRKFPALCEIRELRTS
jgi:hypothetical protein